MKRIVGIGVATMLLTFGNVAGLFAQTDQQQEDQNKEHGKGRRSKDDKEKANKEKDAKDGQVRQQEPPPLVQQHRQTVGQAVQQTQQQRLSQQEQEQRFSQQQRRTSEYRTNLEQQLRVAREQNARMEQDRRSQLLIQQQYEERLRQQRLQVERDHDYDFSNDAFFNTPWSYRYNRGGNYRRTNRYGAELLQQAVNYGYQEGFHAGDADRRDRWRYDFRDSFAYRDANYGYVGRYVDQDDYNYYFRQGFRKGYDDGYYRRSKYGRQANGGFTVFKGVLSGILNLEVIR